MKRAPLLCLLLAGACLSPSGPSSGCGQPNDPLASIIVKKATLKHLSLWHAAAAFGTVRGTATLVVKDDHGKTHSFEASLDGIDEGLVLDASAIATFDSPVELELPKVTPAVTINVRSLLGVYDGPVAGADLGVGFKWRRLANPSDVTLTLANLSLGVGVVPAAFEQIDLELIEDPLAQTPDCNVDADCDTGQRCASGGACEVVDAGG